MNIETLNRYAAVFSNFEVGEDDPIEKGIPTLHVSVFDHWLSEDEAESNEIINYETAVSHDRINEYLKGEEKFSKLYALLSREGVICNIPPPYRFIDGFDVSITGLIVDSLREERRFDMYFMAYDVRIVGGFDRTDLFILNEKSKINKIRENITDCGLYILD
ncbi:hypothetical protein CQ052_12980 [Ochrobactrum sp. MYb15]|uniref:hypothetical protein n=1 Tax=Brucella TaxID=234 RepID=UPI000465B180|nr:hypothetical protein [Brucella rhizosphaerae]PQZ50185.1 hypothetical protein CQZ90_06105 [Ochrobactrum sp. MYb19]PRA55152.1 hypothetical protein CQ062_09645 [Ochrobactrum sp. MYb68]PRA68227.1 hypothetical protein CQ053_01095 [Ochrobactrum sp. MYb18]PRA74546.1 hypothetical protein CQ049_14985 [Brucella thiophenivorans]PRA90477.1 hypothetical protein CQ051_11000 [Ochrobactrum sp. MYb14]PRA95928.1 hypothetical protein CQ052_12980 [Ochrobactrum sp. MYb15]